MAIASNQTQAQQKISHQDLYEQDFCLWIDQAVKLLSENRLSELDRENLIEEIASMGRSEKHGLESNLEVILMHLLKYRYQPEKRSNSWLSTLFEHRRRLHKAFKTSPSLKRHFSEEFNDCYDTARKFAAIETGISMDAFPLTSPFTETQVLDEDYFPE
ncbi:MAG: DUF29 domain-containing protein [Pseudanabaena sp.]|nr:MAG: DUF29 domain-containing protein [Pseudanabaena sp.]